MLFTKNYTLYAQIISTIPVNDTCKSSFISHFRNIEILETEGVENSNNNNPNKLLYTLKKNKKTTLGISR